MASSTRVLNLTTGNSMKRSQARKRVIEHCCCVYVDADGKDTRAETYTVRNLTLSERVAARSEQARIHQPLAFAELPGIKVLGISALNEERRLVIEANRFAGEAA